MYLLQSNPTRTGLISEHPNNHVGLKTLETVLDRCRPILTFRESGIKVGYIEPLFERTHYIVLNLIDANYMVYERLLVALGAVHGPDYPANAHKLRTGRW